MVGTYTEGDEPVPGFRLSQLLGWGRFGEVWKAYGPGGITVAVKIIPLSSRQGLKEFRAIRLVKEIRHPNLVPIMAFWLKDRQGNFIDDSLADSAESLQALASELIIVMGLGEQSLHDRLVDCGQSGKCGIPLDELLGYMMDAARAVDYLNRRAHLSDHGPSGIQHCDIKPHNILVVGGVAQICDLGVARVLEDNRASAATGSAAYIAPEFIRTGNPSSATDQYSLAVTYVELRTGLLPFQARSAAAAYLIHLSGELDLSGLSSEERIVIKRATASDPTERFPTCVAFVKALQDACSRISEAELALIDGVARLNASGLVAGERASKEPNCFGPFHTAAVDECEEDLALSDDEDSMPQFLSSIQSSSQLALNDATATTEVRAPLPRPDAQEPIQTGSSQVPVAEVWHETNPSSQSSWQRVVANYSNNMAKFKMWNSRNQVNGGFDPKQFWKDLPPKHKRYIRYGSQLVLLAVLGIVAGQATSSFSAAERTPTEAKPGTLAGKSPRPAKTSPAPTSSEHEAILNLRNDGKYAEALAKLDKLIAAKPQDSQALLYRAQLETECGNLDKALEDANLAAKSRGDDPAIHACLARIYLAKGDFAQARNECELILKYDFQNGEIIYLRSQALTGLKQYARALADYRTARKVLTGVRTIQPCTALAVASGGLTIDACRNADVKPRIEVWRDRTDSSPRLMDGGPAADLSPNGNTIAFDSGKQAIKIVDLAGKRPDLMIQVPPGPISSLLFVRDGRWLVSTSEDRMIRIWDTETGKSALELEGHSSSIASLAYSQLDDVLASGANDQTIKLWDLKQGLCIRTLSGHQGNVTCLAFAPRGRLLASGSADKAIKLWDSATGAEVSTLTGHSAEVTSVAFTADGRMLASGSADPTWPLWPGQVKLWNTVTGTCVTTFGGHAHGVYKVAFEPESNRLISAGADFELRTWDVGPFIMSARAGGN